MGFFKKYLQSTAGRVCLVGSTVAVAAHLLPNSIFLDKWEAFWTIRFRGNPVSVPFEIYQQFRQVVDDMKLPPNIQNAIKVFNVDGFDLLHAGTPNGQLGGILIGIPNHYIYDNISSFNNQIIVIRREQIDWDRRDAQRLLSSLILTEAAKKFSIATEIARVQSGELYYCAFGLAVAILLQPILYQWAQNKFQLHSKNLQRRLGAIGVTSMILMYIFLLYKDAIACMVDKMVDTTVSNIGPEYIKGGREYYEKIISRNLALRSILEKNGNYYYTPEGNNRFYLRYRTMPVTKRKQFFDDKLCKIEKGLMSA